MAKKKKSQLKPVARGVATTSVPKKIVEVVEEEPEATNSAAANTEDGVVKAPDTASGDTSVPTAHEDEFDPKKVEEQSLQNLVDKLQDKTEKEIVRTIKAAEAERRYAKTFPQLELDDSIVDRILSLAQETQTDDAKCPLEGPEDASIGKLGITYGILRRFGFSEERVEECLRSIPGIDLDEAFEWLYMHCSEYELREIDRMNDFIDVKSSKTPRTPQHTRSSTSTTVSSPSIRTPVQFLASGSSTPRSTSTNFSRLDAKAPSFVPKIHQYSPADFSINDNEINSLPASAEGSDYEYDDPSLQYAKLKVGIDCLTTDRTAGDRTDASVLNALRSQLKSVEGHYFFDKKEAELVYQAERKKLEHESLQSKLRGEVNHTVPPPKRRPERLPLPTRSHEITPDISQPTTPSVGTDIFDGGEDEHVGLFDLLEEMPKTETSEQGTIICVRDLALPKHWSGRTPKSILKDTVFKQDRFAIITYGNVSGASRAKRASVSIHWEGRRMDEWTMSDVACHTETQAEQYIATVALHALAFSPTEGFSSASTTGQTFFRSLPPVFRDVWDELEEARKTSEDANNRSAWAKLRSIIEPKMVGDNKQNPRQTKQTTLPKRPIVAASVKYDNDRVSDRLAADFQARLDSPAYQEMLIQRNTLPIAQYKQAILECLDTSPVIVLSGETGCGKSTQVPAFILEDQLLRGKSCRIYCTEPRRISAISLAQRVSCELGDPPGAVGTSSSLVGYSIRLESNTSKNTRLTYVTNGIALRMLEGGTGQDGQGSAFDEITHVIIDEVHERTIESDFLLIVLKSLLEQRPELRVILMSATLEAEKISAFFGGCPTLHIPGRTFPVDSRYLEDAIEFAGWAIDERSPYARRGNDKFYQKNKTVWSEDAGAGDDDDDDGSSQSVVKLGKQYSPRTISTINTLDERVIPYDLIVRLLERICLEDTKYSIYSNAILIFLPGLGEIRRLSELLSEHEAFGSGSDFKVHLLHSTISSENQGAVFEVPPHGVHKIVLATNIAETGITIPDITCVIDTGKHREMRFDEKRQISRLSETFVAKSNAAQRRGRAGRIRNGLCFHLFTKFRHDNQMAEHPLPEMMRLSLSDLALRIKIMKVKIGSSIEDVLSRALDPPVSINVQRAISMLVEVRALTTTEEITPMGRLLSKLPTDVHLGKFLLIATLFHCLDPALTIAATLGSKSPFMTPFGLEQEADRAKASFSSENSDFLTIHSAFSAWRRVCTNKPNLVRKFCRDNFLSQQNLQQIEELRQQLLGYLIDASFIQVDRNVIKELNRARYSRNRTRFIVVPPELDSNSSNITTLHAALVAGLYPKVLAIDSNNGHMRTITNNQIVSIHPSSINFRRKTAEFGAHHLTYFTLMHSKKLYAWETAPIDDLAMLLLCGDVDFKLMTNIVIIDKNKVKYRLEPKTILALKHLREQVASLLSTQYRGKALDKNQALWKGLVMDVLGKVKPDLGDEPLTYLNLVRPRS